MPFLQKDYFQIRKESILYDIVQSYFQKYNTLPALESIKMMVSKTGGITQIEEEDILECVDEFKVDSISQAQPISSNFLQTIGSSLQYGNTLKFFFTNNSII